MNKTVVKSLNLLFFAFSALLISSAQAFYDSNLDIHNYNTSILKSNLKKSNEHWKYESGVAQELFLQHLQYGVAGISILSEAKPVKEKLTQLSASLQKIEMALTIKSFGCASIKREIACEIIYTAYSLDRPVEFIGRVFGFIDFTNKQVHDLKIEFLK